MNSARTHATDVQAAVGAPVIHPIAPPVNLQWGVAQMAGEPVKESTKALGELDGLFHDAQAYHAMDPAKEIYRVRWWSPVAPGTPGGLFWGVTILQPGTVGDEFFMTHGHIHADRTRAEYYAAAAGRGLLVLMDDSRKTWCEEMSPGSIHYIDGRFAHRVVNIGSEPLMFWACWGSDAGYDYGTIRELGFGARVLQRNGHAVVVPQE